MAIFAIIDICLFNQNTRRFQQKVFEKVGADCFFNKWHGRKNEKPFRRRLERRDCGIKE